MSEPMLEFDRVSFSYRDHAVMEDVSFAVERGEFVALLGPNGTGKSTILRLADGLLHPTAGAVRVAGADTATVRTSDLARTVGFLFQNPDRQICRNTVREEVAFGLETLHGAGDLRVGERTEEVLALLHLDGDVDPFSLSKGQRQAVALAGLIAADPELLLLDEPTTGFDYAECMEMMAHIKRMNRAGTTVLMVCHDMEVVSDFAERVVVMAGGRVLADGPAEEVFSRPDVMAAASVEAPQVAQLSRALSRSTSAEFAGISQVSGIVDLVEEMVRP